MSTPPQTDTRGEPQVAISTQGAKSDKKVTAYVKTMLEAFKIHGEFTLTTNFANDDGHAKKYGIRIRTHGHSGVELEVQPEQGSSRFYESWLAWKGHTASELRERLHAKFAGQTRFRIEEWKDHEKVLPFAPAPTAVAERVLESILPTPTEIIDEGREEEESLKGYATKDDDRNIVLIGVYETFRRRTFTADQFVATMRQKCNIRASTAGLKVLLRRLTKKGFFNSRSVMPIETFYLSDPIVEHLADSGLVVIAEDDVVTPSSPETGEVTARILELSHRAEQFRLAKDEFERNDDDQKLLEGELATLEKILDAAKKRLERLKARQCELAFVIEDPAFSGARAEIAAIVQRS